MQQDAREHPSELRSPHAERRGRKAGARAVLYSFFAQALSAPSRALWDGALDGSLSEVASAALSAAPLTHRRLCALPVSSVVDALVSQAPGDALEVEYARLFGNGVLCPHYEAAYVSNDPFRDVHVVAEIAEIYRAHGVRVADSLGERPDHVAVELEFMNFLASKQALASMRAEVQRSRQCRDAQREFLSRHLGCWLRSFCRTLADATRSPFYAAVARALDPFLDAEEAYLRTSTPAGADELGR